jgi:hypothetical protein
MEGSGRGGLEPPRHERWQNRRALANAFRARSAKVRAVAPKSGNTKGDTIVTNSGFPSATKVYFGPVEADPEVLPDDPILAYASANAADTVDIPLSPSGTSSTSSADQPADTDVTEPGPVGSALWPILSSSGGTEVWIESSYFAGATAVTFGDTPATAAGLDNEEDRAQAQGPEDGIRGGVPHE